MKLPSALELQNAVLFVMQKKGSSMHFKEIELLVAQHLSLNEDQLNIRRSGNRTEFAYRLSWARTALSHQKKIIRKEKGFWNLYVNE